MIFKLPKAEDYDRNCFDTSSQLAFHIFDDSIEERIFRDPWNPDRGLRPSPSTQVSSKVIGFYLECLIKIFQSEMFATAPESEGEEWEGGRGGWEEEWGAGIKILHCFAFLVSKL